EVTFDIDANGILHVSAKDLGTGNEQKIVITASTNLTDQEIDKAVKESEKFAEEDKKRKEDIEVRNNADSIIYQTEKTLKDLGDKVSSSDKEKIEGKVKQVKDALSGNDDEKIKSATDDLTKSFYDISSRLYQQAGPKGPGQGGFGANQGGNNTGNKDDIKADYKVDDNDNKNKK
ncbi:MAG TPA: molecular chaperone DnaK, partial [Clostridiaceae bacterium]|nr:molecular chaperone DnaK [Clostridiaceae bacterium]